METIPAENNQQYKLQDWWQKGFVYMKTKTGIYGLPQAYIFSMIN